jgi:hypothetical protein
MLFNPVGNGWIDLANAITTPTDRLGEVPARVVSQLEGLHSSTILYESREFPQLFRLFQRRGAIRQGLGLLTALGRSGAGVNNPVFGSTMKRLSKLYREGHLGIEYGLFPTVREVRNVYRELAKRKRSKHSEFSVTVRGQTQRTKRSYSGSGANYFAAEIIEDLQANRVDGAHVSYERPHTDFFQKFEEFERRYIGVNPLGIIWEVLPLSFCLDWIFSIDDMLDTLWLNSQSRYEVHYWTSVKLEHKSSFKLDYIRSVQGSGTLGNHTVEYAKAPEVDSSVKSYVRTRREPPSPLSSARLRGANVYNLYLAGLIALGFRK